MNSSSSIYLLLLCMALQSRWTWASNNKPLQLARFLASWLQFRTPSLLRSFSTWMRHHKGGHPLLRCSTCSDLRFLRAGAELSIDYTWPCISLDAWLVSCSCTDRTVRGLIFFSRSRLCKQDQKYITPFGTYLLLEKNLANVYNPSTFGLI